MKKAARLERKPSLESKLATSPAKLRRSRTGSETTTQADVDRVARFRRQEVSVGCSLCAKLDLPKCLSFEATYLRGAGLFDDLCMVCNHDRSLHITPEEPSDGKEDGEKSGKGRTSQARGNSSLFALDLQAVAAMREGPTSPRRQRLFSSPVVNLNSERAVAALDLVDQRRAGSVPHGAQEEALVNALERRKRRAAGGGKGGYARRFFGKAKMLKQSAVEDRERKKQRTEGQKTQVPRRKSETNLKNHLIHPPAAPRKGGADTPRSKEEQDLRTEMHHLQASLNTAEKELRLTKGRLHEVTLPLRKLSSPGISHSAFADVLSKVRRASHTSEEANVESGSFTSSAPKVSQGEVVHSHVAGRMAASETVLENGRLRPLLLHDVGKPRREGSSRSPRGLREVGSEAELMKQGMLREYHLVSRTGSNRVRPKLKDAASGIHRTQQMFTDLLQELEHDLYEPLLSRLENGEAHLSGNLQFSELEEMFLPYLELRAPSEAVMKAANRLVALAMRRSSKESSGSSDDFNSEDSSSSAKNKPVKRSSSSVSSHQVNTKVKRKNKRTKKVLSATRKLAAAVEAQIPLFAELTANYPRCYSLASRPDWRAVLEEQQLLSVKERGTDDIDAAQYVALLFSSPFENTVELLRSLARVAYSRTISGNSDTLECVCSTISHLQLLKKRMHFMLCNLTKLSEGSASKLAPEVAAMLPAGSYLLHEARIRFFTDFAALKSVPGTLSVFTHAALLQVKREGAPLLLRSADILAVFSDPKRYLPPAAVAAIRDNALVRSVMDSVLAIVTLEGSLLICTDSPKAKTILNSHLMDLIDAGHNAARDDVTVKGKSGTAEEHQKHQLLWDTLV